MGLFGKSVKKMQAEGDVTGLINHMKPHPTSRNVQVVADFKERAVPGLLIALTEGCAGVPAALAVIGQPSMAGLTKALSSSNGIVQRDAAAALLAMAVREVELTKDQVEALEAIERDSPYLDTAAVAIAANSMYETRCLQIDNADEHHKHPNLGSDAEVKSLACYVENIGRLAFPWEPNVGAAMGGRILFVCSQRNL